VTAGEKDPEHMKKGDHNKDVGTPVMDVPDELPEQKPFS
jgi:hypothetical protein